MGNCCSAPQEDLTADQKPSHPPPLPEGTPGEAGPKPGYSEANLQAAEEAAAKAKAEAEAAQAEAQRRKEAEEAAAADADAAKAAAVASQAKADSEAAAAKDKYEAEETAKKKSAEEQHPKEVEEGLKAARAKFDELDTDNSGGLEKDEVVALAKDIFNTTALGGMPLPREEQQAKAEELAEMIDSNHDGKIDFDEFGKWFREEAPKVQKRHFDEQVATELAAIEVEFKAKADAAAAKQKQHDEAEAAAAKLAQEKKKASAAAAAAAAEAVAAEKAAAAEKNRLLQEKKLQEEQQARNLVKCKEAFAVQVSIALGGVDPQMMAKMGADLESYFAPTIKWSVNPGTDPNGIQGEGTFMGACATVAVAMRICPQSIVRVLSSKLLHLTQGVVPRHRSDGCRLAHMAGLREY